MSYYELVSHVSKMMRMLRQADNVEKPKEEKPMYNLKAWERFVCPVVNDSNNEDVKTRFFDVYHFMRKQIVRQDPSFDMEVLVTPYFPRPISIDVTCFGALIRSSMAQREMEILRPYRFYHAVFDYIMAERFGVWAYEQFLQRI